MADELPAIVTAVLTLRTGEPLGRARGGMKERFDFSVAEGYGVLREKCLQKLAAVCVVLGQTNKPLLRLQDDSDVYFKRAKNDPQDQYVRLSAQNFSASVHHRWQRHEQSVAAGQDLLFEFFLYVDSEASSKTHRATPARVGAAAVRRRAYEVAQQVSFGPITSQHLDVVNARQNDETAYVVPTDNTTRQAIELDEMREAARDAANPQAGIRGPKSLMVKMKLNGVWVPVEVDVATLRAAVGLPLHDIFSQGIYHGFTFDPLTPTHAAQVDVDHEEDEEQEG